MKEESISEYGVEAETYADSWRPEDKAVESAEAEYRAAHPDEGRKESEVSHDEGAGPHQ